MEELLRGMLPPERRIHLPVTVARCPLGTRRRARLTRTRMVVKHRPGMPLHGHLIRIRIVATLLRGMPLRGLPTHTLVVTPRLGVMMEAEHLAGVEDGRVGRITTINGETHRLRDQPTQATLHSLHRHQQPRRHLLLLQPQLHPTQVRLHLVLWDREALCTRPPHQAS